MKSCVLTADQISRVLNQKSNYIISTVDLFVITKNPDSKISVSSYKKEKRKKTFMSISPRRSSFLILINITTLQFQST
jgi:hypothetical protein